MVYKKAGALSDCLLLTNWKCFSQAQDASTVLAAVTEALLETTVDSQS